MSIKKLVFIFLTVINFNVLHAQSNNDTQLWLGVSAKKKFKFVAKMNNLNGVYSNSNIIYCWKNTH